MTVPSDRLHTVWRWADKAEQDFRAAEYLITMPVDCPTDTVCFHCQQCAEKYLKALLIYQAIAFPKTHDLVVLYNLLGGKDKIKINIERIQPLNRYAIEARYPGDWSPISIDEAADALVMAQNIRSMIHSKLPSKE